MGKAMPAMSQEGCFSPKRAVDHVYVMGWHCFRGDWQLTVGFVPPARFSGRVMRGSGVLDQSDLVRRA